MEQLEDCASYWVEKLGLQSHPEGGYYKEVYRSADEVTETGSNKKKSAITSIYYLLEKSDFSAFHRISSDEIWYFHKGDALIVHILESDGRLNSVELSEDSSGVFSHAVNGGRWFSAELKEKLGFALVSCAVAPGFEFAEFELATKRELCSEFSNYTEIIDRLCRG
ncbi:cupin domain-containing protein [Pedobacter miscanthi]|uniref:cupin domain-containing protein n=1 Tax=Pedobacter miscanthi TaxID=2259170 RepID=UPI00292D0C46|nr:cupin domain-containing protein [Pedobacter miscanthi]